MEGMSRNVGGLQERRQVPRPRPARKRGSSVPRLQGRLSSGSSPSELGAGPPQSSLRWRTQPGRPQEGSPRGPERSARLTPRGCPKWPLPEATSPWQPAARWEEADTATMPLAVGRRVEPRPLQSHGEREQRTENLGATCRTRPGVALPPPAPSGRAATSHVFPERWRHGCYELRGSVGVKSARFGDFV